MFRRSLTLLSKRTPQHIIIQRYTKRYFNGDYKVHGIPGLTRVPSYCKECRNKFIPIDPQYITKLLEMEAEARKHSVY